jgi:quercetin dioxygenase-like cupin family protein
MNRANHIWFEHIRPEFIASAAERVKALGARMLVSGHGPVERKNVDRMCDWIKRVSDMKPVRMPNHEEFEAMLHAADEPQGKAGTGRRPGSITLVAHATGRHSDPASRPNRHCSAELATRAPQPCPSASLPMLLDPGFRTSLSLGPPEPLSRAWPGERRPGPTRRGGREPILSATETANGAPILLPRDEAQVLVSRYEIPAGAKLPVHSTPFPRMAYVLSGTLVVTDVSTGTDTSYSEGSFVIEMVEAWHFGRNDGPDAVQLLVIDLVPEPVHTGS